MAYDDAANLWRSVDEGTAFIGTTTWFANDGWATLPVQPEIKHNGNSWELDVPEGIGNSQWQGQVKIFTTLSTAQTDAYNFQCTVVTDNDAPGVTIKLTESDYSESDKRDGNFYFDGRTKPHSYPRLFNCLAVTRIYTFGHFLGRKNVGSMAK